MSDQVDGSDGPNEALNLDRAQYASSDTKALTCELCQQPIADYYYHVGGKRLCKRCQPKVASELGRNPRFWRAAAFGIGAAILGSTIWYAVIALTGYELGLIAVIVGLMVGGAVKVGSGRGGLSVQLLAVFLTYTAIVSAYAPLMYAELQRMAEEEGQQSGIPMGDRSNIASETAVGDEVAVSPTTPPAGVAEASVFLEAFASALTAWSEGSAPAERDRALEPMYGALRALLMVNTTPTFAFGGSEVMYGGVPLPDSEGWMWNETLASFGMESLAFDETVTRVDLERFLNELATMNDQDGMSSPMQAAFDIAFILVLLYLAPVLAGLDNIIGLLIIGFALWEAWKLNHRGETEIRGPFQVKGAQRATS